MAAVAPGDHAAAVAVAPGDHPTVTAAVSVDHRLAATADPGVLPIQKASTTPIYLRKPATLGSRSTHATHPGVHTTAQGLLLLECAITHTGPDTWSGAILTGAATSRSTHKTVSF